jgi:FkbM family methyltransferase
MTDSLRIRDDIPWWFNLIRKRIAKKQRGPWLMLRLARTFGWLQSAARFPLNAETILVPLYWPEIHLPDRLDRYEPEAIAHFSDQINHFADKAVLIDCGADIGLYSRLTMQRTSNIREVILFEPNQDSYAILKRNFEQVGTPSRVINAGVSNFVGFAVLENVSPNRNPHGGFIRPAQSGIPITTIDSLDLPPGLPLALKIDVEGEEMRVLEGAARTIAQASGFVIQLEAAKSVSRRTGDDPGEQLRFLQKIRPCRFTCFEESTRAVHNELDLNQPFYSQFPEQYRVIDVMVHSI